MITSQRSPRRFQSDQQTTACTERRPHVIAFFSLFLPFLVTSRLEKRYMIRSSLRTNSHLTWMGTYSSVMGAVQ